MQVVYGVFVAFKLDDFEAVGDTGLWRCWPTILPVGRKDHFLKPRFEDGLKVFPLFDQDVIPTAAILTIQGNRGTSRRSSTCKVVEHHIVVLDVEDPEVVDYKVDTLGEIKIFRLEEALKNLGSAFTRRILWAVPPCTRQGTILIRYFF